jgi:hypothetical protein
VTPDAILAAGWEKPVAVLDRGRYVRYDFSTATKLLEVCKDLREQYGSVRNLLQRCHGWAEVRRCLQGFKGVGPVTTRIFLRDVKPVWSMRRRQDSLRELRAAPGGCPTSEHLLSPAGRPGRLQGRADHP